MTSTIVLTGGRRRSRAALTAFLATAAVAGGLTAAVPSAQAVAVAADVTLRPGGDVSPFQVKGSGASAASVLDDSVKAPALPARGDAIVTAGPGDTTAVLLGGRIRSTLRPSAARAWFFGGAQGDTSLRVEVVSRDGAVLAAKDVAPGQGMRWSSLTFEPSSRAALKGLSMRFIAVGGDQAQVRAAYASVTARTGRGVTLRPTGDVAGFDVIPSGTATAALDDDVDPLDAPSYAEGLRAGAAGRSTTIDLTDLDGSGSTDRVTAWFHATTGRGTRLLVQAVSSGQVQATSTLPASSAAEWHEIDIPITGASAIDDLQLRFTSLGGGHADVAAAQATVDLPGQPFTQLLDSYAATLPPMRAGLAKPAEPTGPAVETVSEPMADVDAPSGQSRFRCVTTPVRVSSNPEKIVTSNPDGNKMWLGALLQGHRYAGGPGSLADLPTTGERAPLKIWTDLMGADIKRTVNDPDGAEVQQAISEMVRAAQEAGVPAPARIAYSETSQSSIEDGLIKAGLSVKYMKANGSVDLTSQRKAQRSSMLVSFTQRSFTVNLVRPNTFSGYFDERFTAEDLDAMRAAGQIGPDNPPVVISNIAYGRVLYYSISSTATQADLEAAVKASYEAGGNSGSVDVSTKQQEILNQAEVKVFAMGGPTAGVENLIRTHKIQDYFAADNTLDRAVPISYQVDNLDGTAASFTETTSYDLRTCEAIDNDKVDVGDVIRIQKPKFYLDANRSDAEMYGTLSLDGVEFWNRTREKPQLIQNHVLTNPTSTDPGVDSRLTWPQEITLDNATNPLTRIQGSMNCKLWFGDGSNQYGWSYDSRSSQPGSQVVHGGSKTCGTQLKFEVTKVRDVYEYRP